MALRYFGVSCALLFNSCNIRLREAQGLRCQTELHLGDHILCRPAYLRLIRRSLNLLARSSARCQSKEARQRVGVDDSVQLVKRKLDNL